MSYIGDPMENRYGEVYTVLISASDFAWDQKEEDLIVHAMFPRPINRILDDE